MFSLDLASLADRGMPRRVNADAARVSERLSLAIVAERVGETDADASWLVVDSFENAFSNLGGVGTPAETEGRMVAALEQAHQRVRDASGSLGPVTTALAALSLAPGVAVVATVGRTRCYRIRGAAVVTLAAHDDGARAGGVGEGDGAALDLALSVSEIEIGDVFVLCSDSIAGALAPDILAAQVTHAESADDACRRLLDAAATSGPVDDFAIAVARLAPSTVQLPEPSTSTWDITPEVPTELLTRPAGAD